MKEIIALQEYTDKYVSFYEGEIRNLNENIADKLIEKGIVAEHDSSFPSSGGSSTFEVNNAVFGGFNSTPSDEQQDTLFKNALSAIKFGDNVESIGNYAFGVGCTSLKSVEMPNITSIGQNAFVGCTSLESVEMPNVKSIGQNAFQQCISLESVKLPKVESIGQTVFTGCTSLKLVEMPNVKSIEGGTFNNCTSLESVYIGEKCTSIGNGAFYGYFSSGLTINCGFAEGAVSGAPWGAGNVVINYNVPAPSNS